jgi:hypothetical protein
MYKNRLKPNLTQQNQHKKATLILAVLVIVFFCVENALALNWSISCTNGSCEASAGALKVFWTSQDNSIDSGEITGVNGIPLSIEDYETTEKKIEKVMENAITSKSASETGIKAAGEQHGSGGHAQESSASENLFANKRSMSQSKTQGKKVGINYNLAFVKWLGDSRYARSGVIGRYLNAEEEILKFYNDGSIGELIDEFFVLKNAEKIDGVAVDTKITDENRELVFAKYMGVTVMRGAPSKKVRYETAYNEVKWIIKFSNEKRQQEITTDFKNDIAALAILMKPGQTALDLYKTNKDMAFAKWYADVHIAKDRKHSMIQDRYILAIYEVRTDSAKYFSNMRKEFETAIAKKDTSTQIILVPRSYPVNLIIVVSSLGVVCVWGFMFYRKKAVKAQAINS